MGKGGKPPQIPKLLIYSRVYLNKYYSVQYFNGYEQRYLPVSAVRLSVEAVGSPHKEEVGLQRSSSMLLPLVLLHTLYEGTGCVRHSRCKIDRDTFCLFFVGCV